MKKSLFEIKPLLFVVGAIGVFAVLAYVVSDQKGSAQFYLDAQPVFVQTNQALDEVLVMQKAFSGQVDKLTEQIEENRLVVLSAAEKVMELETVRKNEKEFKERLLELLGQAEEQLSVIGNMMNLYSRNTDIMHSNVVNEKRFQEHATNQELLREEMMFYWTNGLDLFEDARTVLEEYADHCDVSADEILPQAKEIKWPQLDVAA